MSLSHARVLSSLFTVFVSVLGLVAVAFLHLSLSFCWQCSTPFFVTAGATAEQTSSTCDQPKDGTSCHPQNHQTRFVQFPAGVVVSAVATVRTAMVSAAAGCCWCCCSCTRVGRT